MFIVALFTIAKIWKQPKRPSTDEYIKSHIYIGLPKKFIWVLYGLTEKPK